MRSECLVCVHKSVGGLRHLCETCYTLVSVPFSPIGSSSIVDQQVEMIALLLVGVGKVVYACWLCKI